MSFLCLFGGLILLLCACDPGIYHTVKSGQTLYRISRTYKIDEAYLARLNGIHDPSAIPIGTRLFIPGAERVLNVHVVKSQDNNSSVQPSAIKKKPTVSQSKSQVKPSQKAPTTSSLLKSKATQVKKLKWPLRGKIVRSFSNQVKTGGGKGIEISIREGSHVKAAEAGKVIYSGDGVSGYGFLIILQHENDFFTVYGFNRKNIVQQGDFVSQGENIAMSGTPPSGGSPRLHFEVRKGKLAVNPILYLP